MEHRSLARAAFNCDDFPPPWICIGRRGFVGSREQNCDQDPSSEPEKQRVVSLSVFLSFVYFSRSPLSLSLSYGFCTRSDERRRGG